MKIYSSTNVELLKQVQSYLNIKNKNVSVIKFPDSESMLKLEEEVVNETVFIIQSLSAPTNDAIIHTLFLIELLKQACVKKVILILTYLCYARQDRITCRLSIVASNIVCKLLSNVDSVLIVEPHCPYLLTYFNTPSFEIDVSPVICEHISKNCDLENVVLIALDHGAQIRTERIANSLGVPQLNVIKTRGLDGIKTMLYVNKSLVGKVGIIIDDIIDTGKSVKQISNQLMSDHKLDKIIIYCTHAVMSTAQPTQIDLIFSNSISERKAKLDISYLISRVIKYKLMNKTGHGLF
ncbi:Ribose-phosphate pyrophosphokinase [Candidatus Hodgkinia cicadicola]|uniref:ribose-phosphate diphosphokinase n=1 Tax=Candidatus Hodgkinia cicadicola TaxID=573658 RepID=A0ABX4MFZ5_9HYPH|nr:Ribose-phosphate pyrophosphokinase [Candidatus Hodgkinia cicadicola]